MHPDDKDEKFVDDPARGKVVWACEWKFYSYRDKCLRLPLTLNLFSPQIAFVSKGKFPSGLENHSGSEVSVPWT